MFNEIDATYIAALGILSPIALIASGIAAILATLGLLGVWLIRTWVHNWTQY